MKTARDTMTSSKRLRWDVAERLVRWKPSWNSHSGETPRR